MYGVSLMALQNRWQLMQKAPQASAATA